MCFALEGDGTKANTRAIEQAIISRRLTAKNLESPQ